VYPYAHMLHTHTHTYATQVFDCWFESGSMPYAQCHYPFENKEKVTMSLSLSLSLSLALSLYERVCVCRFIMCFSCPRYTHSTPPHYAVRGELSRRLHRRGTGPDPRLVLHAQRHRNHPLRQGACVHACVRVCCVRSLLMYTLSSHALSFLSRT
jgi:hypothetical protein